MHIRQTNRNINNNILFNNTLNNNTLNNNTLSNSNSKGFDFNSNAGKGLIFALCIIGLTTIGVIIYYTNEYNQKKINANDLALIIVFSPLIAVYKILEGIFRVIGAMINIDDGGGGCDGD